MYFRFRTQLTQIVLQLCRSLLISVPIFMTSQAQTTYSKKEESMAQFVNNGLAYALKYDSLQRIQPILDSCRRFLKYYPNSFVKPNVFSYMLEMTTLITTDKKRVFPLIDSVLYYDKSPSARMRIAELLIERDIDAERGATFLEEAFPYLTVKYHRYKSHLLAARVAFSRGAFTSADHHIKSAITLDSTRLDAWYALHGLFQMREQPNEALIVSHRISELLSRQFNQYVEYVKDNTYIGKSVSHLQPSDLDGNIVSFRGFAQKVVVIQLFNFWCGTPEKEFPTLKKLINEFPQVKFVFLNAGETPEELKVRYFTKPSSRFLKTQTIVFSDSSTNRFFGGRMGMGEILLIDKKGRIRFSFPGMAKNLEHLIREHLHELLYEE